MGNQHHTNSVIFFLKRAVPIAAMLLAISFYGCQLDDGADSETSVSFGCEPDDAPAPVCDNYDGIGNVDGFVTHADSEVQVCFSGPNCLHCGVLEPRVEEGSYFYRLYSYEQHQYNGQYEMSQIFGLELIMESPPETNRTYSYDDFEIYIYYYGGEFTNDPETTSNSEDIYISGGFLEFSNSATTANEELAFSGSFDFNTGGNLQFDFDCEIYLYSDAATFQ